MPTFLLKTEPSEFSYARLAAEKRAVWDGITNNAALAHLRTARKGDEAFIYHTGDEKAIVGLAQITSDPYADPNHPGLNAAGAPRFAVVDLAPLRCAKTPMTLEAIKADRRFSDFALVRQSRLSVMPVPANLAKIIRAHTGL
jgi:predicted RNA-binding protein with PUA-like domain